MTYALALLITSAYSRRDRGWRSRQWIAEIGKKGEQASDGEFGYGIIESVIWKHGDAGRRDKMKGGEGDEFPVLGYKGKSGAVTRAVLIAGRSEEAG